MLLHQNYWWTQLVIANIEGVGYHMLNTFYRIRKFLLEAKILKKNWSHVQLSIGMAMLTAVRGRCFIHHDAWPTWPPAKKLGETIGPMGLHHLVSIICGFNIRLISDIIDYSEKHNLGGVFVYYNWIFRRPTIALNGTSCLKLYKNSILVINLCTG